MTERQSPTSRHRLTPYLTWIFLLAWSGFVLFLSFEEWQIGGFRWGRGPNAPLITRTNQPIFFWTMFIAWVATAVGVLFYVLFSIRKHFRKPTKDEQATQVGHKEE